MSRYSSGLRVMEMMAVATTVCMALSVSSPALCQDRQDKRELADLGQGHGHSEGDPQRIPQQYVLRVAYRAG